MLVKCRPCKGNGVINHEGKRIGNGMPYDTVCGQCNGRGYHEDRYTVHMRGRTAHLVAA